MSVVKISVVVITYNQEKCIVKALDSLTCQKDWIYEIVVSDDCSKDNTWQVVNEYASRYQGLVKPYQNDSNLGIYGNMLAGYKHATGNVIATLAGDDEYTSDCFKTATLFLEQKEVLDKAFLCFFDCKRHFVDKRIDYIFDNSLSTSLMVMSYALRGKICEPTLFSPKIIDKCLPPTDLGKCADFYWKLLQIYNSEVILYCHNVGFIYNAGIGVSVTASLRKTRESDRIVYGKIIRENEFNFGVKDINYVKYLNCRNDAYFEPSWKFLFFTTWSFLKGIDMTLGGKGISLAEHAKFICRYIYFLFHQSKMM